MRVLLVEDSERLQRSVATGLRQSGYAVDVAGNGTDGLWRARSADYDVIVLDVMLPGLDGLSGLARLREEGRDAHVLLLTARDAVADRVGGLRAGADDYLVKPFAFEELLARVGALARRRHGRASPVIRVGGLEIDTAARTVKRGGQPIHLTPREYALLEFLAFHRGKVATRSMIWEHLYDEQDESTSNVVDVYIRYLRAKIDKGFDPPLILTRWGEGYMLRGDD